MKIKIFAFGKLKSPGVRQSADYYLRLSRSWCQIEEHELPALKIPAKTPALRLKIQRDEFKIITERLGANLPQTYLLDENGKSCRSREWADLLADAERNGQNVNFLIGSSFGICPDLKALAKGSLSLGPQTISHELSRVVLLEQLFRALSILRSHPYHNEG
ncbi:MAG: 23S rRNA (pseudouridine(1915)-N(3))-methyltransferase RlmH [Elusimicrobia bacterium]|nr:23S rRNA (pseudouridine(1915)-N(3))-methyltransferase RlmH [Elusimicrobiota bacterium]